eukprot:Nk52_evm63s343 gene=Nk52_evmTU63s343
MSQLAPSSAKKGAASALPLEDLLQSSLVSPPSPRVSKASESVSDLEAEIGVLDISDHGTTARATGAGNGKAKVGLPLWGGALRAPGLGMGMGTNDEEGSKKQNSGNSSLNQSLNDISDIANSFVNNEDHRALELLSERRQQRSVRRKLSQEIYDSVHLKSEILGGDDSMDGLPTVGIRSGDKPWTLSNTKKKKYSNIFKRCVKEQIELTKVEAEASEGEEGETALERKTRFLRRISDDKRRERDARIYRSLAGNSSDLACVEAWKEILQSKAVTGKTLREAVHSGVPGKLRGQVWMLLCAYHAMEERISNRKVSMVGFTYSDTPTDLSSVEFDMFRPKEERNKVVSPLSGVKFSNLVSQDSEYCEIIMRDIDRTFPAHDEFKSGDGKIQTSLFNVLKAYSVFDASLGYCQGMNFVAAVLLMTLKEDDLAFDCLFFLLNHLDMRKLYLPQMEDLRIRLFQLGRLIHDRLPDLYNHLKSFDISPSLYAPQWFLTLFASDFSYAFAFRILDFVLLYGFNFMFSVSVSILHHLESKLLALRDMESILCFLKYKVVEELSMSENFGEIISRASMGEFYSASSELLRVFEEEFLEVQDEKEGDLVRKSWEIENQRLRKKVETLSRLNTRLENEEQSLKRELEYEREQTEDMDAEIKRLRAKELYLMEHVAILEQEKSEMSRTMMATRMHLKDESEGLAMALDKELVLRQDLETMLDEFKHSNDIKNAEIMRLEKELCKVQSELDAALLTVPDDGF